MVACTGLQTDVQSLQQDLSAQITRTFTRGLGFRSQSKISPKALASLTSHILYRRKNAPYYVEPLVIGLEAIERVRTIDRDVSYTSRSKEEDVSPPQDENEPHYRPFLCSFDMIGASSRSASFVCAGAATKSLYGTAEALWKEDLSPQDLVRLCGEAFLSALERDCLSGYGALVYLITANGGIVEYDLDTRND
jgi:20S proteasome subunit beta 3